MISKNIKTSVDIGNKNIHILSDGMANPIVIPNTLKDSEVEISNMRFGLFSKKKNPLDVIDCTITSNGKELGRKYIGKLALDKGGKDRDLRKTKYNSDDIVFSFLSGVALSLLDLDNPQDVRGEVISNTNLPIEEYRNPKNVNLFKEKLLGSHKVVFNSDEYNNSQVEFEIKDNLISILPEGTAALLNIMTDKEGYVKKEFEDLSGRIIIVVDIGGGSVDISAVQDLELIEGLIYYSYKGTRYFEEKIIKELALKHDYVISSAQLDYYIREKNSVLPLGSGSLDISGIVERELGLLAQDIITSINNLIEVAPADLRPKIAKIALTGGASQLLSEYILEGIEGYDVIVSDTALFDNAIGGYKQIMNKRIEE